MFHDRFSRALPGVSTEAMAMLHRALVEDMGISQLQVVESVAYSMAMVVRAALGLHADQAEIAVAYQDSLNGWISLATARHLINAGSRAHLIQVGSESSPSSIFIQLMKPLLVLGTTQKNWEEMKRRNEVTEFLSSCHALLCGLNPEKELVPEIHRLSLCQALNEHSIPVHCISAPLGLDLNTGDPSPDTLYASSTLSLGIPYQGLDQGADYVGRHYLADISLSSGLIEHTLQLSYPILFAEQPVIQIYPVRPDEPAEGEAP